MLTANGLYTFPMDCDGSVCSGVTSELLPLPTRRSITLPNLSCKQHCSKPLCFCTEKLNVIFVYLTSIWATLSYSARGYDSAVCCSKMSCDAFLMKQIKRLKSSLQRGSVCVYEMADGADGESQMYVLFCYFA